MPTEEKEYTNKIKESVHKVVEAITDKMILQENLRQSHMDVTGEKRELNEFKELREVSISAFMDLEKEMDKLLKDLGAAQVDENLALQKKKKKKEAAWRVNGDPARDSYAQRRSGYHRFLKEMRQENAQLKMEVQNLKSASNQE